MAKKANSTAKIVKDLVNEEADSGKKVKTSLPKIIFNVFFWIVIIGLAFIWIIDFVQTKKDKEPIFCIKTVVHEYEDGKVSECIGLGYRIYSYDRTSKNIQKQFSPFFIGIEE